MRERGATNSGTTLTKKKRSTDAKAAADKARSDKAKGNDNASKSRENSNRTNSAATGSHSDKGRTAKRGNAQYARRVTIRLREWLADHCRWFQYPVPRVVRTELQPAWRQVALGALQVVFAVCIVLVILYRNRNTRGLAVGGLFLAALLAFLATHEVTLLF